MTRVFVVFLIFLSAAAAFAEREVVSPSPVQAEISAALGELSSTQIGTLTVGDIEKLAGRIAVAARSTQYVQRARMASLMMPGAGQFMTGDAGGGSLFLAADIAAHVGAMVGAYFLLPANVRFDSLDYLGAPVGSIKTAWEANSFMSYLPSMGVMAGGMLVKGLLGMLSSSGAANLARKNLAEGKVTFAPTFGFMGRGFGMGMGMRF